MTDLTVVEFPLPDYLDPVKMLRNVAEDIESGKFGDVSALTLITWGDAGLEVFAGGKATAGDDGGAIASLLCNAANFRLSQALATYGIEE